MSYPLVLFLKRAGKIASFEHKAKSLEKKVTSFNSVSLGLGNVSKVNSWLG